jgi:hypothetical protein
MSKKYRHLQWLLCGAFVFGAFALPASATIYYVDDDAPGGIGTSWATAFNDFQDALNVVGAGDVVRVAGGRYVPSLRTMGTVDRSETFWLEDGVEYYGGYRGLAGGGDENDRDPVQWESILDGDRLDDDGPDFANRDDNCYHVVNATTAWSDTLLDGFTIRGGNANYNSGYPGYFQLGGGVKMFDSAGPPGSTIASSARTAPMRAEPSWQNRLTRSLRNAPSTTIARLTEGRSRSRTPRHRKSVIACSRITKPPVSARAAAPFSTYTRRRP